MINIGTGFGILLGLAVGLISGLMIAPERITTVVTTGNARPGTTERIENAVRTLLVQRASLIANVLRLEAAGQSSASPTALLEQNGTALASVIAETSNATASNQLTAALNEQATAARNLVILTRQENATNIPDAQQALRATESRLMNSLRAATSGDEAAVKAASQKVTTATYVLATSIQQPQNYQAESNLVARFDELATFLRSYRP